MAPQAVTRLWRAVEGLYRSGAHPAIQLCVRRRWQTLINRAIGHLGGNGPDDPPDARKTLATPETPFNVVFTAKAVTSMVLHLLDERNLLRIDDRVCDYIPEFGVHHEEWITIRHLLPRRAGIPNLRSELIDLDRLRVPDWIVRPLCDEKPLSHAGRQLAYHAISGGFILGEVVQRVTKKDIRTVLSEAVLRPLGFRRMNYGVRRRDLTAVGTDYFTGLPPLPPVSIVLKRAFGVGYRAAVELSNDPRFLTAIVPSANLVSTANELSRFFQLLLRKGGTGRHARVRSARGAAGHGGALVPRNGIHARSPDPLRDGLHVGITLVWLIWPRNRPRIRPPRILHHSGLGRP